MSHARESKPPKTKQEGLSNKRINTQRASKAKQIRSLMEDSGYSRSEATKLVNAGF